MNKIIIKGAREHNLKNIDLELPRNKFIVFTGISGSGKSTLAFDTIFAEGQRRYLESLSSYARQFLGQMDKPDVDYIEGLSPAISIDQKAASHNPRSTVGTVTEIHDYLRLLYAKIGIPHCPVCGREITKLSTDEIVDRILESCATLGHLMSKNKKIIECPSIEILSPVVRGRKGEYSTMLEEMFRRGFSAAYINGKKYELDSKIGERVKLERYKKHTIDILVDSVEISSDNISRIFEGVEKALKLSRGLVKVKSKFQNPNVKSNPKSKIQNNISANEYIFNQNLSCPIHDISFPDLEPRLFSFNSPFGACPACEGLGVKKEIDPDMVAPDKNKTIAEGAIMPWSYKKNNWQGTILRAVTNHFHIKDNVRLRDLSDDDFNILMFGAPDAADMILEEEAEEIPVTLRSKTGSSWKYNMSWRGAAGYLQDRYYKTDSDAVRTDIEKYMSQNPCSVCRGARYKKEVLLVTVGGKNISEISSVSVNKSLDFFKNLKLNKNEQIIAGRILKEIVNRLGFLENVGLGYLMLSRSANTLAGGESQRIRLASQIGSQLVGVLYIMDEPSIGLHARDNAKLLETLLKLRDIGNTLIVVEHDEETMRAADYLVDIGPGAGKLGGEIVAQGLPEEVIKSPKSLTAAYLRHDAEIEIPKFRRPMKNKKSIIVRGAREHNLRNVTVEFPLKVLTCVTGVSGSGKSTLVEEILYKSLASRIMRSLDRPGRHSEIVGTHHINKVIMIDQSPIGRTPRSNPATYTGLFTPIRELFSETRDAKSKGYGPGRFSFNVKGGRCDNCQGDGQLKIEMQFMPDVYLPCDVCGAKRYNSETLKVKYKGKNISEVLEMTVSEGRDFFENFPEIHDKLAVLEDVGLGYIQLGQAATTLSGGEAQRIKLATELSRRATGDTLYILDEPTTGLHFDDIKKLLGVLNRLVDAGNTVVVIEHNMDVIKTADWIIDLGPEGGDGGGRLIVSGTPEEVSKYYKESWTGRYLRDCLNH
ncbi:MAG: excinuclease ABC subunit A [Candidatus Moranbacteria bacterium RIFOXYA12_FULL_44_15]|nr:MAG: excinuclease ABC subunit A [Candidatus Moranbacteria bacterium RIFOXYA12_FULL_44_15]